MNLLLKNAMVYRSGEFEPLDIAIRDGVIAEVAHELSSGGFTLSLDCRSFHILPGLVDVHVHLREPGFSYKETIAQGTLAAARGGYTALCAMPNLNPPPDSPAHLSEELAIIARDACIPVYPYGTITRGQKGDELVDFPALAPSVAGFSDDGVGVQRDGVMLAAMRAVAKTDRLIAAHCEDNSLLNGGYIHDGEYARAHGHKGISSASEWAQIERDIGLVRQTGCKYHVCHISTKESVELIRQAKREGLNISCETAPHYLLLTDLDLREDGRFKMNPPLRSPEDRDALLEGLRDGTIDLIATDHAPHSAEEKSRGLRDSAMGIVGLETAFPLLYTYLVKRDVISFSRLIELMCLNPRRRFNLPGGEIVPGQPADLCVLDLSARYDIDPETFLSKGRNTPFGGTPVEGETIITISNGRIVWQKH